MGVGQLSESDAVDALRLPFYSSSHPTGAHGWRNQFDLGNPDFNKWGRQYSYLISFGRFPGWWESPAFARERLDIAQSIDSSALIQALPQPVPCRSIPISPS